MKCLSVCDYTQLIRFISFTTRCRQSALSPSFKFTRTLSRASLSREGVGGAVETSAVHHGRVCPARRNEPLVHIRSCAVDGLQLPSSCAARLVFRRMTLQQRHRGDLPSSPTPSREAGTNPSISSALAPMVRSCTSGAVGRSNTKKIVNRI